jgi:hypothetical protein
MTENSTTYVVCAEQRLADFNKALQLRDKRHTFYTDKLDQAQTYANALLYDIEAEPECTVFVTITSHSDGQEELLTEMQGATHDPSAWAIDEIAVEVDNCRRAFGGRKYNWVCTCPSDESQILGCEGITVRVSRYGDEYNHITRVDTENILSIIIGIPSYDFMLDFDHGFTLEQAQLKSELDWLDTAAKIAASEFDLELYFP